ncbi:hypothetical protein ACS0TY_020300 [Phlomoides rotata]
MKGVTKMGANVDTYGQSVMKIERMMKKFPHQQPNSGGMSSSSGCIPPRPILMMGLIPPRGRLKRENTPNAPRGGRAMKGTTKINLPYLQWDRSPPRGLVT